MTDGPDDEAAAYAALRTELEWPRGKELSRADLVLGIARLGGLAGRRGAEPLAELAAAVVAEPENPELLYDLGYALIDAGAPAIAATILWRCLGFAGDSEDVVTELVSALESALAYPDALAILEQQAALRAKDALIAETWPPEAGPRSRLWAGGPVSSSRFS